MSTQPKVGISEIAIYLPRLKIDLETVIRNRAVDLGGTKLEKILRRSLAKTGLLTMHFPEIWEDPVTMAAHAAYRLIRHRGINLSALRYMVSGTETAVDHSKPLSAYVIGMLKKAGLALPQALSTFQTQHACAGGTVALLSIAALLGYSDNSEDSGIVMCSDIAKYEKATPAEITQGAGAVAILAEKNPKLIALDLATVGYSSKDVDDFFRPLGSDVARVKGSFSVRCYIEAMEAALLDHAVRAGTTPVEVLKSTDMFALHVPYPKLPIDTMKFLLNKYLQYDDVTAEEFLHEKGFFAMTYPASRSGNIYTGSLFMSLAFLLKNRLAAFGSSLPGKKILLGSYGSGNTMVFAAGTIAKEAPEVIRQWDLESIWEADQASMDAYENWISANGTTPQKYGAALESKLASLASETFYLSHIREDGYREYHFQA